MLFSASLVSAQSGTDSFKSAEYSATKIPLKLFQIENTFTAIDRTSARSSEFYFTNFKYDTTVIAKSQSDESLSIRCDIDLNWYQLDELAESNKIAQNFNWEPLTLKMRIHDLIEVDNANLEVVGRAAVVAKNQIVNTALILKSLNGDKFCAPFDPRIYAKFLNYGNDHRLIARVDNVEDNELGERAAQECERDGFGKAARDKNNIFKVLSKKTFRRDGSSKINMLGIPNWHSTKVQLVEIQCDRNKDLFFERMTRISLPDK